MSPLPNPKPDNKPSEEIPLELEWLLSADGSVQELYMSIQFHYKCNLSQGPPLCLVLDAVSCIQLQHLGHEIHKN